MDATASGYIHLMQPEIESNGQTWIQVSSHDKSIARTTQKRQCSTCRVCLVGIIALLLLQVLMILCYLSTFNYSFLDFKYPLEGASTDNVIRDSRLVVGDFKVTSIAVTTRENTILNNEIEHDALDPTDNITMKTPDFTTVLLTAASFTDAKMTTTTSTTTKTTTEHSTKKTVASPLNTTLPKATLATAPDGSIVPSCPPEPPNLQGRLNISFNSPPNSFEQTKLDNPLVTEGGHGKPPLCIARHKVAIIIPYRDRVEHLRYFLQYMHPILQRQQVEYQIFIINQQGHGKFNRAKLMNVGFLEALKIYPFQCFSFHDVDLVLEDDRSLYWCSSKPRHMSAGVDKFKYQLPYENIFGGVTLLSKEQMESINGFSNEFWGWGGEDDDVFNRLKIKKYQIVRYPMEIARYKMIQHKREKGNEANPKRFDLIRNTHLHYEQDGLNSVKYKVSSIDFQPTYTNVTVDLMGPP